MSTHGDSTIPETQIDDHPIEETHRFRYEQTKLYEQPGDIIAALNRINAQIREVAARSKASMPGGQVLGKDSHVEDQYPHAGSHSELPGEEAAQHISEFADIDTETLEAIEQAISGQDKSLDGVYDRPHHAGRFIPGMDSPSTSFQSTTADSETRNAKPVAPYVGPLLPSMDTASQSISASTSTMAASVEPPRADDFQDPSQVPGALRGLTRNDPNRLQLPAEGAPHVNDFKNPGMGSFPRNGANINTSDDYDAVVDDTKSALSGNLEEQDPSHVTGGLIENSEDSSPPRITPRGFVHKPDDRAWLSTLMEQRAKPSQAPPVIPGINVPLVSAHPTTNSIIVTSPMVITFLVIVGFWTALWLVALFRAYSPFTRTLISIAPALLFSAIISYYTEEMSKLQLGPASNVHVLFAIKWCSVAAAALLLLDVLGVLALIADVWRSVSTWAKGTGWRFAWGWTKDGSGSGGAGGTGSVRVGQARVIAVETPPWERMHGDFI